MQIQGPGKASWVHFAEALLPDGWVTDVRIAFAGGRITQITADAPAEAGDERHGIAIPGMGNLHSHAFQRAMAGLAEHRDPHEDGFWSWREAMYRFVQQIDPDDLRAIAAMAQVEMLECGFTRVGEFHYLHHDRDGQRFAEPAEMAAALFAAAEETGIGITCLPVFYAHSGFGGRQPQQAQRRFVCDLDGFARLVLASREAAALLPDAVVGIAPHSLRAVAPDEFAPLLQIGRGGPVHIHVAEQMREVEECIAALGARPVRWLLDNVPVGPDWCLVHATHADDDELAGIAAARAVVGLCPITEANLGDGVFPADRHLARGGRFGIGSDSNVLIDMAGELRLLEYGQRLRLQARNVLAAEKAGAGGRRSTGRTLFEGALLGGAQALGLASGIAPGNRADIVALDPAHPSLLGRRGDSLLDSFVFAAGRGAVSTVWRSGAPVVRQGRHIARDRIEAAYRHTLKDLLA